MKYDSASVHSVRRCSVTQSIELFRSRKYDLAPILDCQNTVAPKHANAVLLKEDFFCVPLRGKIDQCTSNFVFMDIVECCNQAAHFHTSVTFDINVHNDQCNDFRRYSTVRSVRSCVRVFQVVTDLGLDFTEEEMRDMIEEADPSGDGRVSYQGM